MVRVMRGGIGLLAGGIFLLAARVFAAGPPIQDYTVYGVDGVKIGAGSIVNGLTGAQNNAVANSTAVKINGAASVVADVRSGGNVNLANGASVTGIVYHAAGTSLTLGSGATIGGEVVGDPGLPSLPAASIFPCPSVGPSYSFANSASLTLTPGTYGSLSAGGLFTLILNGAGDYFFNSIATGNGATINVSTPGVRVFVCGAATFGSASVLPTSLTNTDLSFEVHASSDNAFRAAGGSQWIGDVFAPNGQIHFGGSGCCSSFNARFWAGGAPCSVNPSVDIEHGVTGGSSSHCCLPLPRPPKESTIVHGNQNTNNGANFTARVQYQVSSLFGFDVVGVDFSGVEHAFLVLHVQNRGLDDPPANWPNGAGDLIKAYRLTDGFENWAEGNGFNFPTIVYRGDGNGVTWNCVTDTDISNTAANCSGTSFWDSGGQNFQGIARSIAASSPNLKIANGMADGSEIWFDVTADVQAGLGPLDLHYMTWFVRKPSGAGFVSFYSREGAAFIGNPAWAPQLVITP